MPKERLLQLSKYFLVLLTTLISLGLIFGDLLQKKYFVYLFIFITLGYIFSLWFAIGTQHMLKPKRIVTDSAILLIAFVVFFGNTNQSVLTLWPFLLIPLFALAGYVFSLRWRKGAPEENLQGSQNSLKSNSFILIFALGYLIPGLLIIFGIIVALLSGALLL